MLSRETAGDRVQVRRGSLYLCRRLYERYFAGLETVVLLRDGDDLIVLPVRFAAAGGYLLKLRNGAGDRIVHGADFFRRHGIEDEATLDVRVEWRPAQAGLAAIGAFALQS